MKQTVTTEEVLKILYDNLTGKDSIGVDGRKILEWILDTYTIIPIEKISKQVLDIDRVKPPAPSTPAPENITYKKGI